MCHSFFQSWARVNTAATTWPCFQATNLLVMALYPILSWLLQLDTETLTLFMFVFVPQALLLYVVALLRCRCREAKKLSRVTRAAHGADWWISGCRRSWSTVSLL